MQSRVITRIHPRRLLPGIALVVVIGCGARSAPREITITASDYHLDVAPSLPPGLASFTFVNHGRVLHEVQFYRFRAGLSPDSARRFLAADSIPESAQDASGGVLIAVPGATAHERLLVALSRGELYAAVCEFRDADSLPPHARLGMFALVRVE